MRAKTKPVIIPTKERIYMNHATFYGMDSVKRHIARYKWAASHLFQTDIVLDAGCGSGYGTKLLSNACARAVGVDISTEAIDYAKYKSDEKSNTLEYRREDLSDLPINELFDAVVCIEVIEHLDKESQLKFMKSITHVLAIGGRFIVTTPVKKSEPMTEYHKHEFSRDEFKDFLGRHFCSVHFDDPLKFGVPVDFMLAVCNGVIR